MLPYRWVLLNVILLVAFTNGVAINSSANDDDVQKIDESQRSKRSYKHGQTQSQYLNFGHPELDGKADAEATEGGSRSTVSGTHGMGQAQSQFSSGDCSGCGVGNPLYEYSTGSPDPLRLGGSYADTGKPSSIIGLNGASPTRGFTSDGSIPARSADQGGRPTAGAVIPGAGIPAAQLGQPAGAPGSGTGRPGSDSAYAPGGTYAPGIGDARQFGRPGAGGAYVQGTSGTGQFGRPGADSDHTTGGTYFPATSGTGQFGRPGTGGVYAPGSTYAPGTGVSGQIGRPSARDSYIPSRGYAPGVAGMGQTGTPETSGAVAPGGGYIPAAGGAGQAGRPGLTSGILSGGETGRPGASDFYGPSSGYTPGTSGVGHLGRPGSSDTFTPGGVYTPITSTTGHIGRPGTPGTFSPATTAEGQVGRQGSAGIYSPGGEYSPGRDITGQAVRPGSGDAYAPGSRFIPGIPGAGQTDSLGAGGVFAPVARYAPAPSAASQSGTYAPQGVGQVGATGTSFGYGSAVRSGAVGQQEPSGSQAGIGLGPQAQTYGRPGQQTPTFTPGTSYPVPGGDKQQVQQYGLDGRRQDGVGSQSGQPLTSYGQAGQQISAQKVSQPGGFYGPGAGYNPSTGQQVQGYPQEVGYGRGYTGPIAGATQGLSGDSVRPGTHYSAPGSQQILRQPVPSTVLGPGTGGLQQGIGSSGQQPGSGVFSSYQAQPGTVYGQPGQGPQAVQGSGYQPGSAFGQQGHVPASGGFDHSAPGQSSGLFHPRYDQMTGSFVQPGVDRTGYGQPGAVQQSAGPQQASLHPPESIRQTGSGSVLPSSGIQPGAVYGPSVGSTQPGAVFGQPGTAVQQGAGLAYGQHGAFPQPGGSQTGTNFDQRGMGLQPISGSFGPEVGSPGEASPQVPSSLQQIPGYGGGYGQPSSGRRYPQETSYEGIQRPDQSGQQTGIQPGSTFGQHPGSQFSQPGGHTLPATGTQHGAGYDSTYGHPGHGQFGSDQYAHPGRGRQPADTESSRPGFVQQYGQAPQTIVQAGTRYIPGGTPTTAVQQPTGVLEGQGGGGGDDAFSQAESSIGNGQAAASAQGKKNGGTAKTQVQGTYSSSGSFSASAMTSDNDRSASSQVTGGVEGAMSQSQGQGGAAQSQAQVQVNEKTGGTKASSQSGGIIHQSQSEVQANDKGGLADAQSSGPGQTSSQAQIGFRPGQDGEIVRSAGGGQASSQSGAHSGNSQSQIQGTSKYGVSYHGAAQSASGTKEQVATYREQNRDLFNTISHFGGSDAVTDRVDTVYTPALTSESDIPDLQLKASRTNKEATNSNKLDDDTILTDEEDEEEPYDEYEEEEDYYNENPIKMESKTTENKKLETSLYLTHTQKSPTQTQQVAVADPSKKYTVVQKQNGRVQTYPTRTTTETVPNGFRGTVNVEKKFHTKSLESHKTENKLNITADEKSVHKPRTPDSFVTVTKSITGSMDNSKNPPKDNKNFQSTYYTKSSTCGYFTFSCNIVYGANGRSKICRPKSPTNGKC